MFDRPYLFGFSVIAALADEDVFSWKSGDFVLEVVPDLFRN